MNNVVGEEETGGQHLLSLRPLAHASTGHMRASHSTLGQEEEEVVTLEETDGDPLLLCPMDDSRVICQSSAHLRQHHLPVDATLTYATLDSRGNIVLQQFKSETHGQSSQEDMEMDGTKGGGTDGVADAHRSAAATGGPRLVVVGEGGLGDAMTYIYIQGEAESVEDGNEMEASDAHTITLNSADGSTLQTLPAAYTQHLEHTYGDLVVVGGDGGSNSDTGGLSDGRAVSATLQEVTASGTDSQQDEQVLLLSVAPLKLEDESEQPTISLPSSSQETIQCQEPQPTSVIMDNVVPSGRSRREGGHRDDTFPDDETSIEARLATRDALLPPRRSRRCGDPSKLTCPICHSHFKSARHYHSHLHVHRGQGLWHCDICEYTCDSAVELRLHKTQLHQDARPFKCPNCHLSFPKSLMLEDHIRNVHNKERPYTCSFCTKGFYRPHDLKMHLNLHLGIKSNVCHICGRQFSHPSNLIRHQRLHTGIKPYVCATCGKRFTQVTLLHKHRTTHQPGAGVCSLCPSTFRSAAGLRKHSKLEHKKPMTLQEAARIIRGQRGAAGRSYYCRVCGAQFSLKSELKDHEEEEHSKNTQHACASCNKVYSISEVKTHTCLTAEEEEQRNRLCSPPRSVSPEATITAIASTSMMRSPGGNNSKDQEEAEEEEEEYLVMYITPEGESVSYVMKKGSKVSRDAVLQVDAPRTDQLHEDGFSRPTLPEETIMINVQERPLLPHDSDDHTIIHCPEGQDDILAPRNGHLSDLNDDNPDSPMAVHSIKLEPQTSDDMSTNPTGLMSKSLLPFGIPNIMPDASKMQKKSILQPISIKGKAEELEIKKEHLESGTETKEDASTLDALRCKDCGKTFQKQWNYQQHIATHDASLHRYKCGLCTLTFAYRSTLNRHIEKHRSNHQLHQCKQCSKAYKCLSSLKQHHKRDHMLQRPFVCDLCGKDFFSKSDFKYHMRVHKKEQPYMCFACGREFSHVSHLHRHERVHTGERPHKCPFCPKKFIQFVTLKIHLKKHEKKGTEDLDMITGDARFSDCDVGINLAVEGDIVNNEGTAVGNMSNGMGSGEGEGLNTSRNPVDSLAVHGDSDTRLDRSVMGHSSSAMMSSATDPPELSGNRLPPGTIILAQGNLNGTHTSGQFSGGHTAVVTGMDGDCIAIFVQESLE
nr:zinc finger protein 236-like [Procambarus clarkii]XP_045608077.1 zinc finger protein 236-like [Procambarus clarkii]XP_045608088.1 zinc finger protein 236-like [Procambarus clarkii]